MTHHLFLSLGSNLGSRPDNLRRAIHRLRDGVGLAIKAISPVYETAPWGNLDQPNFLNLCLAAETDLLPLDLLAAVKAVELDLGRQPAERWGPRLIDIDLLNWDELIFESESLTLPHPQLSGRAFVLAPLADIAPNWQHPQTGRSATELLADLDQSGVKRLPLPLEWGWRTLVMGILNITPDSFSGDGLLKQGAGLAAAVAQARQFVADGADVLDIGGESTRPGSQPITVEEELARVIPAIQAIRPVVRCPISVDTYRAEVAQAALAAGADWLNDVWGGRMDGRLMPLAAQANCPVVIMHNRSKPKNVAQESRLGGRYVGVAYQHLIQDVRRELQQLVDEALAVGVRPEQIIIDPGLGFGKTVNQNLQLLNQLDQFSNMGYPILVGPSRKSFIGYTLNLPPEERLEGTAAAVAIAIVRGANIVRVHDVRAMARIAHLSDRILGK